MLVPHLCLPFSDAKKVAREAILRLGGQPLFSADVRRLGLGDLLDYLADDMQAAVTNLRYRKRRDVSQHYLHLESLAGRDVAFLMTGVARVDNDHGNLSTMHYMPFLDSDLFAVEAPLPVISAARERRAVSAPRAAGRSSQTGRPSPAGAPRSGPPGHGKDDPGAGTGPGPAPANGRDPAHKSAAPYGTAAAAGIDLASLLRAAAASTKRAAAGAPAPDSFVGKDRARDPPDQAPPQGPARRARDAAGSGAPAANGVGLYRARAGRVVPQEERRAGRACRPAQAGDSQLAPGTQFVGPAGSAIFVDAARKKLSPPPSMTDSGRDVARNDGSW